MAPIEHIGQPSDGRMGLQVQVTPNGHRAHWMHNAILMPAVPGISVLVLVLILWCVFAYRRGRTQPPSLTAPHTVLSLTWPSLPVILLVLIALRSEVRRVMKECVSTVRSWGSPSHYK